MFRQSWHIKRQHSNRRYQCVLRPENKARILESAVKLLRTKGPTRFKANQNETVTTMSTSRDSTGAFESFDFGIQCLQIMRMLIRLLLIVWLLLVGGISGSHNIKAPSIFRADEVELHKFSAVLAATQPFNRLCTDQIRNALNPIKRLTFWLKGNITPSSIVGIGDNCPVLCAGKPLTEQAGPLRRKQRTVNEALSRYESRVENVLK